MNKLLFPLLFLALTTYAQMQERIAIINTLDDYDSISVANLTYLTDKLRETAVNLLPAERFGVMTTESIVAFLGSQERLVKVCKESSCLAELGRQVSADFVAQGRIGRFGKDLTIKVELYNVKTGNLIGSFAGYSKDIYGLLALIDEKAPDLFKKMLATTPPPKPVPQPPPKPQYTPPEEPETPIAKKNIEEDMEYMDRLEKIQELIKINVEKNKKQIQKESFYLSPYYKRHLYYSNKIEFAVPLAALNVLPSFGLGSYIQRDIVFGITQSVLDVLGIASYTCAIYLRDGLAADIFGYTGIIAIATSRITGLIRPFYYRSSYNKTLREALNIDENISFFIDPLIVPRDGTPAVGLAFNVRY